MTVVRPVEASGGDLLASLVSPVEPGFAGGVVVVSGGFPALDDPRRAVGLRRLSGLPCVVVAEGTEPDPAEPLVDLVVSDDTELADVLGTVRLAPIAATSLALHLRTCEQRPIAEGLVCESALYSTLQAGPEHHRWLAQNRRAPGRIDGRRRVQVQREGDRLVLVLDRAEVRNALDSRMRDELLEALAIAVADPAVSVELRGEGRSFCAGGDLGEFGTAPDPATAHVVRLRRSIGAVLALVAERTTVRMHGPCAGSGVELAAFAGRVIAAADTTAELPELALGLIPGAGGTVSLPRRIGRHRTAWLALTRRRLPLGEALEWGVVDEVEEPL